MRLLVTIDLTEADVKIFEAYEATVLPLLKKYGARLEMRVRALDGSCEIHLLCFPDADAHQNYLADPVRAAARHQWEQSGAKAAGMEVKDVPA